MNIIVPIKQVPDISESQNVRIDPETNTLIRQGVPSIVNPFDMYAVEEAIRIKKKIGHYDMIICGKQAIDGDTAQVGPGIAEWFDIPQITFVRKIEEIRDNYIRAQ